MNSIQMIDAILSKNILKYILVIINLIFYLLTVVLFLNLIQICSCSTISSVTAYKNETQVLVFLFNNILNVRVESHIDGAKSTRIFMEIEPNQMYFIKEKNFSIENISFKNRNSENISYRVLLQKNNTQVLSIQEETQDQSQVILINQTQQRGKITQIQFQSSFERLQSIKGTFRILRIEHQVSDSEIVTVNPNSISHQVIESLSIYDHAFFENEEQIKEKDIAFSGESLSSSPPIMKRDEQKEFKKVYNLNTRQRLIRLLGNDRDRSSSWNRDNCDNGSQTTRGCQCNPGYYYDNRRCKECNVDNCSLCEEEDRCNQCNSGYYLTKSQRSRNRDDCSRCRVNNCDICNDQNTCQKCSGSYVLNSQGSCITCNVDQGQFVDANNICKQCSNCSSCKGEADNQCQSGTCTQGRLFVPQSSSLPTIGSCIICDEQNGFFVSNGKCLKCHSSCKTCNGTEATNCTKCMDSSQVIGEDNKCVVCSSQVSSFLDNSTNRCKSCDNNCLSCKDQSTNCLSCKPGMGLDNNKCINCQQQDGVFIDGYGKCVKCDQACKTCTKAGSQYCVECAVGYSLDQKICKKCDTSAGFYIAGDKSCQKCNDLCATCTDAGNSKQACQSCKGANKWLYTDYNSPNDNSLLCGTCKTSEGFYIDDNGICKKCPQNCVQCSLQSGNVKCDKCATNLFFDGDSNLCKDCDIKNGKYVESLKCKQCDSTCATCKAAGPNSCITCAAGFIMHQQKRTCVKCDQIGEIKSIDGTTCMQCLGNCKECNPTILSACTSCKSTFYLMPDNSCQKCEGNQYISGSNCNQCHFSCNGCQSKLSNECKGCASGYSKKQNTSLFECIQCPTEKYFTDPATNVCSKCDDSCLECNGPLSTNCVKCQSGEDPITNGGRCSIQCKTNEYYRGSCLPCHSSCKTCSNADSSADEINKCIECLDNSKKMAVSGQPNVFNCVVCDTNNGYYSDNIYCYKCQADNCNECSGDKGSICTKCKDDWFLLDGKCVQCTDNGYYKTSDPSTGGVCNNCPSNCKTCTGPYSATCSACIDDYYFNENNDCISCPDELFYKSQGKCISCHPNCLKCENTQNESSCTICKNNQYLIEGTCKNCPSSKYFEKKDEHKCLKCDDTCETCSAEGVESCLQCRDGLYFHSLNGKKTCSDCDEKKGFFIDTDSYCKPCSDSCATCSGLNANQCLTCKGTLALMKDNTCAECSQDKGYFIDPETKQCEQCHSSCKTCSGTSENNCKTCPNNKYLSSSNMCVDCTNAGEYQNKVKMQCILCHSSCNTCDGPNDNNCLTCTSQFSYFEDSRKCQSCPSDGFFTKDSKCIKCDESCQTCKGSANTECTNCKTSLSWTSQNKCEKCPQEKYFINQDNNSCEPCTQNCKKCSQTTQCQLCDEGYLIEESSKQCVKCEEDRGYFADLQNGVCKKCDPACITCSGPASSDCKQCKENYFKIDKSKQECTFCGKTDLYQRQSRNCQSCDQVCSPCTKGDTYVDNIMVSQQEDSTLCQQCKCNQCKSGFQLVNGSCISNCSSYGDNYENDPNSRACKCKDGFPYQIFSIVQSQQKQYCSAVIPNGFMCLRNNRCYSCGDNCQQCLSLTQCAVCNNNYYLWEGKCIPSCFPDRNIIKNDSNNTCQCANGYIYMVGEKDGDPSICLIPLKLEKIEIQNPFMDSGRIDSSSTLNNKITFYLNRPPRKNEISDFSIFLNQSTLVKDVQYFIRETTFVDNLIIVEVEVPENRRVSEITYTLNGQKSTITLKNTVLTSQEFNKEALNENNTASEGIKGVSGLLTPKEGDAKAILDNLKKFQILCFLSNFVQVLAPITLFKESIPPQIFIGGQLGASFIFSDLQAVNEVSFSENITSASSNNQTNSTSSRLLQIDYELFNKPLALRLTQEKEPEPQINQFNTTNQKGKGRDPQIGNKPSDNNQPKDSNNTNQNNKNDKDKDFNYRDENRGKNNNTNNGSQGSHRPSRENNTVSSPPNSSNSTNSNTSKIESSEVESSQSSQMKIMSGFGLSPYLYGSFILAHLIIVISVLVVGLCLLARVLLPGKQYTLVIVNKSINLICSFAQGSITSGLFSIYYSLQFGSSRGLAIFQLIVNVIFMAEIFFILKSRSIEYITDNIPNFFDGINPKAKGAKSYIFISFLKKYTVVFLFLLLSNYSIQCSITIAIIFFIQAFYIARYRLFKNTIINILKVVQELMISTLFVLLAICIKKYKDILESEVISNSVLQQTKMFSFVIIIFILMCLTISLLIFFIRSIISIGQLFNSINKYIKNRKQKGLIQSSEELADLSVYSSRIHSSNFTKKFINFSTPSSKQMNVKRQTSLKNSSSPNLTEEE